MDRIAHQFSKARAEKRACFVAYICAGDPDFDTSLEICRTLVEGGTDLLELGVPFSDPLADGLTNQLAAHRALESGMTMEKVFDLARRVRMFTDIPIVFYTYYNLVFHNGIENYIARARQAGVDGILTLDLPPEEATETIEASRRHGMANIFIVAPTTPPERVERIARAASGFIYYVSREGVTGERKDLAGDIQEGVAKIRRCSGLPVAVGFGISSREQVRQVARAADGVVGGSALVNCIGKNLTSREAILRAMRAKIDDLVAGIHSTA